MLVKLLQARAFAGIVTVISLLSKGTLSDEVKDTGHTVIYLNFDKRFEGLLNLARLIVQIKQDNPQIIHSRLYLSDLVASLLGAFSKKSIVFWSIVQSNLDYRHHKRHTMIAIKMCAWLSKHSPRAIISNANCSIRPHLEKGYDPSKMTVIPNGIDLNKFYPDTNLALKIKRELDICSESLVVGIIGRFDTQKNYPFF